MTPTENVRAGAAPAVIEILCAGKPQLDALAEAWKRDLQRR
jgi:hypothetical protein